MTLPGTTLTDLAGMDSALRRAAEDARRLTSGFADEMRAMEDARMRIAEAAAQFAPALDLAAQLVRHLDLTRIAQGPIADVSDRLSYFSKPHGEKLTRALAVMEEYNAHFRTLSDHPGLAMFRERISEVSKAFSISESSIVQAMKGMQSPWLDMRNQATSFRAFAELQGIANVVTTLPAFGDHVGDTLRRSLGDWRDTITLPQDIVDDIAARFDFYIGRGFDPTLTDFPRPAFREALATGGLHEESVPEDDDDYSSPASEWSAEEEIRFRATSEAHGSLMRLEVRLRRFIDDRMSDEFGPDWPKHRMPNGLYDRWVEKKKRTKPDEETTWPLIAYADFTDYAQVICRKDNWARVFHRFFVRRESVRESFQRLYPVRFAVMHARPIMQNDELLLRAEVVRLTGAMKVRA